MIQVENLALQYGDQKVLDNVSFKLLKGKIIGLLGPNGAGKSSIIKILSGLVFPVEGKLLIGEKDMPFANLRNYCGYLIDKPAYYPYLSAIQNLALVRKINRSNVDLNALLDQIGLENSKKKAKYFSAGMKQRLAIGMAIMTSPELIILDEPFNGLDPNGFQELIQLLQDLNKTGTTILVSSHLLNELEQFADHFILIHKGKIAMNLSREELQKSDKKVLLTFNSTPESKAIDYLNSLSAVFESQNSVLINIKSDAIANVVNTLVELNCTPVNIETRTVLQDKYFEITA